jgi:arylsulfatase A-like enzyme
MPQPNIILILTDHFRPDALGRSTPNLSRLAGEGVRFQHAYCAAPLCQPARNALITGKYPSQNGVCGNQNPPISKSERCDTFMHRLQNAGYHTAMIGKHHYIDRYGVGMDVTADDEDVRDYGFGFVFQVVDDTENLHNDDEYTKYLARTGRLEQFREACKSSWSCPPHPFELDDTVDGFIGCRGIRFVDEYREERPFYLNLSFVGPHPPFWHPGDLHHDPEKMPPALGVPDRKADRIKRAHYMDRCANIDLYVGRLLAALERRGMQENTVILFTSDHGENAGDFGIWDKRYFYEQSCGVPLVLWGPGITAEQRGCGARVSQALVSHLDLYPTILALAGLAGPPTPEREGRNLLDMLGDIPGSGHDAVFAQLATAEMVRTANWKLVFDAEAGGVQQLFNLIRDPREQDNLAGVPGYEKTTLDLLQRLLEHRIRLTQRTQAKEEQRLQRVRIV